MRLDDRMANVIKEAKAILNNDFDADAGAVVQQLAHRYMLDREEIRYLDNYLIRTVKGYEGRP